MMNEHVNLSLFYQNQVNHRKFSDKLGRYYTPISIAEILCKQLGDLNNCSVLDLGCGSGNLVIGSLKYWNNCKYHVYDIDIEALNQLKSLHLNNVYLNNVDIITANLNTNTFDVAITNPPYIYLSKDKISSSLDKNTQLENEILKLNRIPVPLIFLTKALNALKINGKIGIILPDGILTNKKYESIRKVLINSYQIDSIIKLEPYVFKKTETHAHILIIKNLKPTKEYSINFYLLKNNNLISHKTKSSLSASQRLDFTENNENKNAVNLGKFIHSISRGNVSSKFIKDNPTCKVFHTTDFEKNNSKYISDEFNVKNPNLHNFAQRGDILIARVGRNFHKKIKIVHKDFVQISDCIIAIRPIKNHTKFIYNYLKSEFGQEQLKVNAQGTGAKYITHSQILNLPLIDNMDYINGF